MKLDVKDRRILFELDNNSRQTEKSIAKKVGLSQEVVCYRIKKLEKEGIITGYPTALNLSKLGIVHFKLLLSFQHITSEKLNAILESLKKDKRVKWVVSCKGSWDMMITAEVYDMNQVDSAKNEILSSFSGYISRKAISIGVNASAYTRNFLTNSKTKEERILLDASENEKLNKIDIEIIKKLAENSRKPAVEIAQELKTSARVVGYRIKQLVKKGVITGFRLSIDYSKLDVIFYKCLVYLDNPAEEKIKKLVSYFRNHKNIIHHVQVIGNWELEPEFEVNSEKEFDDAISEIKDIFSDIIKNIEVITITKEHKFVYF